jgi:hypothetical protein
MTRARQLGSKRAFPIKLKNGPHFIWSANRFSPSPLHQRPATCRYKDFRALWKDADPDIPILKHTKAEYAKLQ